MDKTSTPILCQFTHYGNFTKLQLIDFDSICEESKWLKQKFREVEEHIPNISDEKITEILIKAKE